MSILKSARHTDLCAVFGEIRGKGYAIHLAHTGRKEEALQHMKTKGFKNPVDTGI